MITEKTKLLIDCDPGVDDSVALLFALSREDAEIVGIATGTGNTTAAQGADNARRLLKLVGKDYEIPVCVGSEQPLVGELGEFPAFIHGDNGIGNVTLPESDAPFDTRDVCDFLYETAEKYAGEAVLITLGRFTNIAKTIAKYPDFPKKVKRVVAMGGSVGLYGNVGPQAEANIAGDPEAADIAVQQDWDMTMVGLDVTLKTHLTRADIDRLLTCCAEEKRPAVEYISNALVHYMNGSREMNRTMGYCPLHDPLAMVTALDPSVVMTKKLVTRIECGGTYNRGRVVVDLREVPIEGRFVAHCLEVDSQRALNALFAAFQ